MSATGDQHPRSMPPSRPPSRQGGRTRGQTFLQDEVMHLLKIVDEMLPIGPDKWQKVADTHFLTYGVKRDTKSIRRKFADLYRKKEPSGDPNILPEVEYAKRIQNSIKSSAQIGDDVSDLEIDPIGSDESDVIHDNNQIDGDGIGKRSDW